MLCAPCGRRCGSADPQQGSIILQYGAAVLQDDGALLGFALMSSDRIIRVRVRYE